MNWKHLLSTRSFSTRSRLVKAVALTGFSVLVYSSAFTQTGTYRIIDNGNEADVSAYEDAMNAANFDHMRFVSKNRILLFKTGVKIELLSATEALSNGITVDKSKAMADNVQIKNSPVFELMPNGHIRAGYQSTVKTPNQK